MDVRLEDAYGEACKALGETIVRERLLTAELIREQSARQSLIESMSKVDLQKESDL